MADKDIDTGIDPGVDINPNPGVGKNTQFIDAFGHTRLGLEVSGQAPLARFARLASAIDLGGDVDSGDLRSGALDPGDLNPGDLKPGDAKLGDPNPPPGDQKSEADANSGLGPDAVVRWSVRGTQTLAGERFLHVKAQADVALECQRCLSFFNTTIEAANVLQVVGSEAALDDGQDLDPEATERIVGSERLDVLALIEDELILNLPYVPMHDVCPSLPGSFVSSDDPAADAVRPSPFAVLSKLKKD